MSKIPCWGSLSTDFEPRVQVSTLTYNFSKFVRRGTGLILRPGSGLAACTALYYLRRRSAPEQLALVRAELPATAKLRD